MFKQIGNMLRIKKWIISLERIFEYVLMNWKYVTYKKNDKKITYLLVTAIL